MASGRFLRSVPDAKALLATAIRKTFCERGRRRREYMERPGHLAEEPPMGRRRRVEAAGLGSRRVLRIAVASSAARKPVSGCLGVQGVT